jgi:UDP-GlcNAc:undecaprenyl-phosphate GlcNAc-1-phosphate transferase
MNSLTLYHYLGFFGVSLAASLFFTPLVRKVALRYGQVAVPKESRWHQKKTALLGGVGLFGTMLCIWIPAVVITGWPTHGMPCLPVMLGAAAMFAVGLVDDMINMDPQHKLAGQIIIASILIFFGVQLSWTDSKTINLFLTLVWLVGITNAFNLLDNMDGLSAGIAFVAGTFLFLYHYLNPTPDIFAEPVLLLSAVYLGAILGFLFYNFNPASIFMGDAGSLLIGFLLACLVVIGSPLQMQGGSFFNLLSVIAIPILILFIPILDTTFVSVMRKLFRRRISQGGRDHSSHRMVAIGFSERRAVIVLYAFAVVSGLIALGMNRMNTGMTIVVTVFYLLFVIFFWIYLAKVKIYQEKSILEQEALGVFTPILVEITYRRRLFEVLLDVVLIAVAYYTAYLLRFEGQIGGNFGFFLRSLPIVIACQVLCFYLMGVYRGVWESTSLSDLIGYIKAITSGTIMPMLIILFIHRFQSFSRAVFVIYWILMMLLVSLSRLSFRLVDEGFKHGSKKGKPALIYGAGVGGQMALKEIETNPDFDLVLKGFVDDNARIHRMKVKGYPVLGGQKDLVEIIRNHDIKWIIISFKENGTDKIREVRELCTWMGVDVEVRQMRLTIV